MFILNDVNILSESLIKEYFVDNTLLSAPACRISITDYCMEHHVGMTHTEFLKAELRLEFQDLTLAETQRPELALFANSICTQEQAKQIVYFILHHRDLPLIVNCYAGKSRSAAVGKIACEIKNIDSSWIAPPTYQPNPYIYSLLKKEYDAYCKLF